MLAHVRVDNAFLIIAGETKEIDSHSESYI